MTRDLAYLIAKQGIEYFKTVTLYGLDDGIFDGYEKWCEENNEICYCIEDHDELENFIKNEFSGARCSAQEYIDKYEKEFIKEKYNEIVDLTKNT